MSYESAKAQQAINPAPTLEEIIKWQVDRIAELEKELSVWRNARVPDEIMESTRKSILSMVNTRIAELEQEVVMYRTDAERLTMRIIDFSVSPQTKKLSDEEQEACFNRGYKEGAKDYASKSPQIKELSDEEIIEVYEDPSNIHPSNHMNDDVISFARAILKKAREE